MREMSSISTLEWSVGAVNRCGRVTGSATVEKDLSADEVAGTNKLELLKWIREEKKCEWDAWTINVAALKVIWKW